jgi:hypothetical protein
MAFVTISHDHPFFLFDPEERGVKVSLRLPGNSDLEIERHFCPFLRLDKIDTYLPA